MNSTNGPYRSNGMFLEPQPEFVDATDAEIAFWERVYYTILSCDGVGSDAAKRYADNAIKGRRQSFGKI